jgi:hypothetical protein
MPICSLKNTKLCENIKCNICKSRRFINFKGETHKGKLKIKCWNEKMNKGTDIKLVGKSSNKKYWFNCDKCDHNFNSIINGITNRNTWCSYCANQKICDDLNCNTCNTRRFIKYEGLTKKGKLKIKCWNKIKNKTIDINSITKKIHIKCWFSCDVCGHDFNSMIYDICNDKWCSYCSNKKICNNNCDICFSKSLASYKGKTIKNNFKRNCIENGIKPKEIFKYSNKQYLFKCDICKHKFKSYISDIVDNKWCPYCSKPCKKICDDINCKICFNNSFASYTGLTGNNKLKIDCWDKDKNKNQLPKNIIYGTHKKYWFECDMCNHTFKSTITVIVKGCWCPYCCVGCKVLCSDNYCKFCHENSLASYNGLTNKNTLKIKCLDNDKNNNINPRKIIKNSGNKYWFKCDICNNNFLSRISNIVVSNNWCPICKNKTEKMFFKWLTNNYTYQIKHQPKYEWCKNNDTYKYLPFDFCIEELKLIIEVDGEQHFKQVSNWKSPEKTFERDKYKSIQAIKQGYSILRIYQTDIYLNKNNWKSNTKKAIKKYDKPEINCIGCDKKYDKYKKIIEDI